MRSPKEIHDRLGNRAGDIHGEGPDGLAVSFMIGKCCAQVIASWGGHWDHVSAKMQLMKFNYDDQAHLKLDRSQTRTPAWDEMCFIKDIFWGENECVMQLHPPKADYVNTHPHVLHLWKPQGRAIPRPPKIFV